MKINYLYLILTLFIVSCTSDTTISKKTSENNQARTASDFPGNIQNPYDESGWVYEELFDSYYDTVSMPQNIEDITSRVNSIADSNSNFSNLKDRNFQSLSFERIGILSNSISTCVTEVMAASKMSIAGKLSFTDFITSYLDLFEDEKDYNVLYNYVMQYEALTVRSQSLTTYDKKIILISTSIVRHSTYKVTKKPKKNTDQDWTVLVGNIVGGAEGAESSSAEAVSKALAVGVSQN